MAEDHFPLASSVLEAESPTLSPVTNQSNYVESLGAGEGVRESVTETFKTDGSPKKHELSVEQADELISILKARFSAALINCFGASLLRGINFDEVDQSLRAAPEKLYTLHGLEDAQVIGQDGNQFLFGDRTVVNILGSEFHGEANNSFRENYSKEVGETGRPLESLMVALGLALTKPSTDLQSELIKQCAVLRVENVTKPLKAIEILNANTAPAIHIAQPKEKEELIQALNLEEGYINALDTQRTFQLLKRGEKPPSFDQVMGCFSLEDLLFVQKEFQAHKLILPTKGRSFDDLVSAIDGHRTILGQNKTRVKSGYGQHATQALSESGAYLVEGAKKIKIRDFDNLELHPGKRSALFAQYKKYNGIKGVDGFKYIHLMMQALKEGEPIDDKSCTILDEDSMLYVSIAFWNPLNLCVVFDDSPGDRNTRADFRSSVGRNM